MQIDAFAEAKDEYITRYLEGTIGRATWGNVESTSRPSLHCAEGDDGPLGPNAVSRLPHLAVTSDEAAQLGYMSNRDDFERVQKYHCLIFIWIVLNLIPIWFVKMLYA